MEKFLVVKFITENDALAIISSKWLVDDGSCFYPNGPNATKFLKKHSKPAPDWETYLIKILGEDRKYSDARRHLIRAEDTSNLDSEPEECEQRKRNAPKRFNYDDDDESDHENELTEKAEVHKKRSKLSSFPSLNSFSSESSESLLASIPSASSVANLISSTSVTTPHTTSSYISSNTTVINSNPIAYPISSLQLSTASFNPVTSQASQMDNKLVLIIGQMQSTLADLASQVNEIEKKLDRALQNNSTNSDDGNDKEMALIGSLPLNTIEDFEKFEESLMEANFRKLVVKVLISLGGRDLKSITTCMLRRLMSCHLAVNFSFTGRPPKNGEKEKRAFCSTLTFKSIQGSVRKIYPDTKEEDLKGVISLWLQQAKHRQDRRERKTQTEES